MIKKMIRINFENPQGRGTLIDSINNKNRTL